MFIFGGYQRKLKLRISLHSCNWWVFITDTERVYSAVRTESLNIIKFNFLLQSRREIFGERRISIYSVRGLLLSPAIHKQEWLKRPEDVNFCELSASSELFGLAFRLSRVKQSKVAVTGG